MLYTFTFTPRMVTIGVICVLLLSVLLFLAGFDIGERMARNSAAKLSIPVKTADIEKAVKVNPVDQLLKPLAPVKK